MRVKNAVASAEAHRLRVSRFERDGGSLETIAAKICRKFDSAPELMKERHRGGDVSDARKTFAYSAAKEFRAPLGVIAEYLKVGRTAVSAMSRGGREIAKRLGIVI